MRSEKVVAYGQPLQEFVEADPRPQGREVLVRLWYCGVCHSDVHLHDGYFQIGTEVRSNVGAWQTLPHTLGHRGDRGVGNGGGLDTGGSTGIGAHHRDGPVLVQG
jgi:D-arabinose 1-dehydrogenase-like Zn-dependent alcohol dehydrogenase